MKKFLYLFATLLFLVGCQSDPVEVIQTLHADGSKQSVYYYDINGNDSTLVMIREFYPSSSTVYIEGRFKNNEQDGLWRTWRENGTIWSEGSFKNGKRDGVIKVFHENGRLYYSGNYKDGQRVGKWNFFDESGKLQKEIEY